MINAVGDQLFACPEAAATLLATGIMVRQRGVK
jgi:hypothetical protein